VILKAILGDLESPENWLNKGRLIFKEFLGREVGGDNEFLMLQVEITSFGLSCAGIFVCPNLEVVSEGRCIHVFDKDNLLTKVTVEPLVLLFDVGIWVSCVCIVRFTSSAYAPVPLSTNVGSFEWLEL